MTMRLMAPLMSPQTVTSKAVSTLCAAQLNMHQAWAEWTVHRRAYVVFKRLTRPLPSVSSVDAGHA